MRLLIAAVYWVSNAFLLTWWGYGGYEVLPSFFHAFQVCIPLYLILVFVSIYLPLAKTLVSRRNTARHAVFSIWVLISMIMLPQFSAAPFPITLIGVATAVIWFMYIPGERFVERIISR